MKVTIRLYKKKKILEEIEYNYPYLELAKKHARSLQERFKADGYRIFQDGKRIG